MPISVLSSQDVVAWLILPVASYWLERDRMWQRGNYNTIHQELFLEACNNITEVHPIVDKQKKKIRNTRLVISEAWTEKCNWRPSEDGVSSWPKRSMSESVQLAILFSLIISLPFWIYFLAYKLTEIPTMVMKLIQEPSTESMSKESNRGVASGPWKQASITFTKAWFSAGKKKYFDLHSLESVRSIWNGWHQAVCLKPCPKPELAWMCSEIKIETCFANRKQLGNQRDLQAGNIIFPFLAEDS